MQQFEVFVRVCDFFIQSKLDANYISKLDSMLEKPAHKEISALVKDVKAFHSMRRSLCQEILKQLHYNDVLNTLAGARGLIQYSCCPEGASCGISGVTLKSKSGILLVLDGQKLITVHSRYKIILYHFWTLVHMPEEIGLEAVKWLRGQAWWNSGSDTSIEQCTQKILQYNDKQFAKGLYVKLKAIAEYIENKLVSLPMKK